MRRLKKAFTLVELLVVIAIIGVLIALLLPAVQAAREAARRAECSNNLKQIGLSLHGHHDVRKRFPPGGASDAAPFGTATTSASWGSSWLVHILPYAEQNNIYDKLVFTGGSGWGGIANSNKIAAGGAPIDMLICPSSPLDQLCRSPYGGGDLSASNYVGISGVVDNFGGIAEPRNRQSGSGSGCCTGGIVSWGGVLYPASTTTFASMTDGSSNTAVVGEQGDFLIDSSGNKQDWRTSGLHGFMIGSYLSSPPTAGTGGDQRTFNQTTLRYPINLTDNAWTGNCGGTGVCNNAGTNVPFTSAHPTGAMFAYGDGSVHFIAETIDNATLAFLCTRDDGQTFELP